jgi:predicted transcriptional regulator
VSFPCESAIWKALPAIRSTLARALVDRKVSQRRVAELLSTTEASISHYIKGKRGSAMLLGPSIVAEIGHLADRIAGDTINGKALTRELCAICRKVRSSCATCGAEGPEDCRKCAIVT